MANTAAFSDFSKIIAVKCFIVKAPRVELLKVASLG
jgi:hypothetical protein